ncbi:F-box domain-containing protein [Penicillium lagena]|uniref:F-box domain-containing protein n=1 Tax=Penicillium lagena TaxID=94218 RepID=UPI0025409D8D|nr:F-box domain-containing protein [Penicillium lagena]KAJ5624286.1 F-box domain-containing protein [Penicillium lagena]
MQRVINRLPKWAEYTDLANWTTNEILLRLTFDRPIQHQEVMHVGIEPALVVEPKWTSSSLGELERIPQEIVDRIVSEMDFLTIEKFAAVSTVTRYSVQSCQIFVEVLKFAPYMPGILHSTQTDNQHSIKDVWCEMKNEKCRSCGERGKCLFLPTCERVCQPCLKLNPSYWTFPRSVACIAYGLTEEQLKEIPTIRTLSIVNGTFTTEIPFNATEPIRRLIPHRRVLHASVRLALKHAVKIHGSLEALKHTIGHGEIIYADASEVEHSYLKWFDYLRSVPLEPINFNPALLASPPSAIPTVWASQEPWFPPFKLNENSARRIHPGIVSIDFPYVSLDRERLQRTYLCNGCYELFDENRYMRLLSPQTLNAMVPPEVPENKHKEFLGREFFRRSLIFRPWDDLLAHLRDCPGAGWLMCRKRLGMENKAMEQEYGLEGHHITHVYTWLITDF